MHEKKDFQSMTLDELTPIVSMRPGKEYTKEELRLARTVFMEKLGCINPEIEPEESEEVIDAPAEVSMENSMPTETLAPILSEAPMEVAAELDPIIPFPVMEETPLETETEEAPIVAEMPEAPTDVEIPKTAEVEAVSEAVTEEELSENKEAAPASLENEEFILKADSRLARLLYRLYAYLLLPILALESLSFLLASVGTCVVVANVPYIVIHVICAAVYAMLISLAWHQFFHRTKFGLLLNRSLIGVCIIRGFLMLISGTDILWGVIFVALSALFLVYFIGYDSMFIIPSPKRQRVQ